jgi:hypothetical protein
MVCPADNPASEPSTSDDGLYEIADDPPVAARAASQTVVQPMHVNVPASRSLSYETPTERIHRGEEPRDEIRDVWLPVWLIAGGLLIDVASVLIGSRFGPNGISRSLAHIGTQKAVTTVVLLAGMLIATRLRQLKLGSFPLGVLKLAAIAIAPGAIVTLLTPPMMFVPVAGPLVAMLIGFAVYFALIGALFDLDQSDTWYCVMVIFVLSVALYFLF